MNLLFSIVVSVSLSSLVVFFSIREFQAYRRYETNRADVLPYSFRRLVLRTLISVLIIFEIWLLLFSRHIGLLSKPTWFLMYVAVVLLFAIAMVVLAIFDWRESQRLLDVGQRTIFKEFLEEVKRGADPPSTH